MRSLGRQGPKRGHKTAPWNMIIEGEPVGTKKSGQKENWERKM